MGKRIKKEKQLYLGIFNYSRAVEEILLYAVSHAHARVMMINRLAKKHDVHPSHVAALFDGSKDNYSIGIDKEWKKKQEVNNGKV